MSKGAPDITSVFGFSDEPLTEPKSAINPETVVFGADVWEKTRVLYTDAAGELTAGIWESAPGAWKIETLESEYVRLLRGEIRLTDEKGASRHFIPGDSFFVPVGFKGIWENVGLVRKVFVSLRRKNG
jgi:uncharacterized cupin superfamily protein